MSQMPNVLNVIDPVTPSAAQSAGTIAGNLNQEANRKLEAASIAAKSKMEQARIQSEEKISQARLEAEQHIADQQVEATASEHSKYQQFLSAQQVSQQQHESDMMAKRQAHDDDLMKRKQEVDNIVLEEQSRASKEEADSADASIARADEALKKKSALDRQLAAVSVKNALAQQGGKLAGQELITNLAGQAQAEETAHSAMLGEFQAAHSGALSEAAGTQKSFGGRAMEYARKGQEEIPLPGVSAVMVPAGFVAAGLESITSAASNWLGSDTTQVRKSALTDGASRGIETLEKFLTMPTVQGMLSSAGDPAVAANAVRDVVVTGMASAAAAKGGDPAVIKDRDAKALEALKRAKTIVPDSVLRVVAEGFGASEGVSKMDAKDAGKMIGTTGSENERAAMNDAGMFVRNAGYRLKYLMTQPGEGHVSLALPNKEMLQSLDASVAASAYLALSPEDGAKKLRDEWGMGPKEALKVIERVRKRATIKDPETGAESVTLPDELTKVEFELKKQVAALGDSVEIDRRKESAERAKRAAVSGGRVAQRLREKGLGLPGSAPRPSDGGVGVLDSLGGGE